MQTRREFIKTSLLAAGGFSLLGTPYVSSSKSKSPNDTIRVGIVGFSDRARSSLIPLFQLNAEKFNFKIVAVSDLWSVRREAAIQFFKEKYSQDIVAYRNNEEMYEKGAVDAVIISTADFQHSYHLVEAMEAGCDVYVEKPLALSMDAAKRALRLAKLKKKVVQVGSQRRSAPNYQAAYDYIQSGKFGPITMVQMNWNVNSPARWRRPSLVSKCFEKDLDWNRFLIDYPADDFNPRKYLEYRLFWPYSSGIPAQWMSHQIDTIHWFSGLNHPKSVVANGGVYWWKDGRINWDTLTAVFDYGDDNQGFQVLYTSRMHNAADGVKEIYYSNGGTMNLDNNTISPYGGLNKIDASEMGMESNLLEEFTLPSTKVVTDANTGNDPMTAYHICNWMQCVRDRNVLTNAPVEVGYNHSVAIIMCDAAIRTGTKATFDEARQEVIADGKVFTSGK